MSQETKQTMACPRCTGVGAFIPWHSCALCHNRKAVPVEVGTAYNLLRDDGEPHLSQVRTDWLLRQFKNE